MNFFTIMTISYAIDLPKDPNIIENNVVTIPFKVNMKKFETFWQTRNTICVKIRAKPHVSVDRKTVDCVVYYLPIQKSKHECLSCKAAGLKSLFGCAV